MQNCSTQHLHSREAATGCRTCENFRLHRLALNPLVEKPSARIHLNVELTTCVCVENVRSAKQRGVQHAKECE